jgi:hypothetical protein
MPVLPPDTAVSDAIVADIYQSSCLEIKQLHELSVHPPVPVVDPLRLAEVRSILGGLVALVGRSGFPEGRADRISTANFVYDTAMLCGKSLKEALGLPQVPQKPSSAPSKAG